MTPALFRSLVIRPTLTCLATFDKTPGIDSPEAELMLLAIAIQESGLRWRRQHPTGPARSPFQIEPPTANSVLRKWKPAEDFCEMLLLNDIISQTDFSYMLKYNDAAACAIARGLLRLDPHPLPRMGDEDTSWSCYLRCWRPGRPRKEKWGASYKAAMEVMK